MPFVPGIKRLSRLVIDTSKDWASWRILNLGVPTAEGDALRKGTRLSMGEMPDGASGQVLTARGAGLSPIYTGVRGEARTTDPTPLEEGQFWYRSDLGKWRAVEPIIFGEELRSAPSPSTLSYGTGGDSTVIWHCDGNVDLVYELSTVDFSIIRSAPSPSTLPSGIGGDSSAIWHCDGNAGLVYELSTVDFSVIRSAVSPLTFPTGIGGTSSIIWHCDGHADSVYELSTLDLSVIRSAAAPSTNPWGMGGDGGVIWHSDVGTGLIYELSTVDFSVIRSAKSPAASPLGLGGDSTVIWHSDTDADRVYELGIAGLIARTIATS